MFFHFKDEAIKYYELDCLTLYQIILKFSQLIWDHFEIQITKYPTLSSLAFGIFRTHFINKEDILKEIKFQLEVKFIC